MMEHQKIPLLAAGAAIVVDMDSRQVLFSKEPEMPCAPASLTKMMTAMLVLEKCGLLLEKNAAIIIREDFPGIRYGLDLQPGEVIGAGDLFSATLIASVNDGARVLAETAAGSAGEFIRLMNRRARELGCKGTHFRNTHGLYREGHVSCASDMARIALAFMEKEPLRKLVRQKEFLLPATNLKPERRLETTNRLLLEDRVPECIGIKTGFTEKGGGALAAAFEKDGRRILTVVLKSSEEERFTDTEALWRWAQKESLDAVSPFLLD